MTLICSWCLLPDFQPGMLHAQWGTGGFAARLTFPAEDAQSAMTQQLGPQMLADSKKHPILLQPPCQHLCYLLPPAGVTWAVTLPCSTGQILDVMLPWGSITESVGGGGRVRLAGKSQECCLLQRCLSQRHRFQCYFRDIHSETEKGYPVPLPVILVDLSGPKM